MNNTSAHRYTFPCAASPFAGLRWEAKGYRMKLTRITVWLSNLKITTTKKKVSNPMRESQKGPGVSSNSRNLKNMAPQCKPPGDMVLTI